ncbi:hypothetical protein [Winogradskyella flava]|uniref:hypothetical protein n=1 Tax=Winogradskyella flava TaxID=1884876 RepID=UPI002490B279|nr:hypothetical protein [Winogradskyella flava]
MKNFKYLQVIIPLFILLIMASCQTTEKYEFVDVASVEDDWEWQTQERIDNSSLPDSLKTRLFKGQTWKEWRKTFKDCMESNFIRSPYYFGPTSTVSLGSITSKNKRQLIFTAESVFSEDEIKKITNVGAPASCIVKRSIELDLETTLEGEIKDKGNANIRFAIQNAKSTTTTIDGFQVDNIIEGILRQILDNAETGSTKAVYKKELLEGKNVLLNRIIKVSGFTTEIELDNEISADLEAELANNPEFEVGDAGLKVKFSKKNNTTISVKSLGDFVVFGKFVKGKKLNR